MKTYTCLNCGKEFQSDKGRDNRTPKYCTHECYSLSLIGGEPWNKGKTMWDTRPHPRGTLGKEPWNKGKPISEETRKKLSEASMGREGWNKGGKSSDETRKKLSESHRGLKYPSRQGEKNRNWKGGVTAKNKVIRKSSEYENWRRLVFERDNFACMSCGIRGGKLHAHHIVPFSVSEELRFEVSNGMTLCIDCHRQTDTYGNRINSNS